MKRAVHYTMNCLISQTKAQSICVTVSSTVDDVADNWGALKMVHRLSKIRKLRSLTLGEVSQRSFSASAHADPFYDMLDHQLIGVGQVNKACRAIQ